MTKKHHKKATPSPRKRTEARSLEEFLKQEDLDLEAHNVERSLHEATTDQHQVGNSEQGLLKETEPPCISSEESRKTKDRLEST